MQARPEQNKGGKGKANQPKPPRPQKRRRLSKPATSYTDTNEASEPKQMFDEDTTPSPLIHGSPSKEGLPKFHYDGLLDPKHIYFTQGYINPYFSHAPGQTPKSIFDLRDQLIEDPSYIFKVPVIRVTRKKGTYYSPDNRRLWVFRNANLTEVPCKLVKWSPEFVNKLDNGKKEMRRIDVIIRAPK